ncbi:RICIN domain-containing protein [Streptacidiphilus sp. 4-A2]|nr:RICIN domain-containing protein [Streptacidiphilus sp. 4-A2]
MTGQCADLPNYGAPTPNDQLEQFTCAYGNQDNQMWYLQQQGTAPDGEPLYWIRNSLGSNECLDLPGYGADGVTNVYTYRAPSREQRQPAVGDPLRQLDRLRRPRQPDPQLQVQPLPGRLRLGRPGLRPRPGRQAHRLHLLRHRLAVGPHGSTTTCEPDAEPTASPYIPPAGEITVP